MAGTVKKTVNKIRNPNFSHGREGPRHWNFRRGGPGIRVERRPDGGVTVISDRSTSSGLWCQVLRCKPGEYYRVEAVLTCETSGASEKSGAVLQVEPLVNGRRAGDARRTPAIHASTQPATVRAYFQAPKNAAEVRISVGLVQAVGSVTLTEARFIHILEPEEQSHPLAIPAPGPGRTVPQTFDRVCVCAERGDPRPITALLRLALGDSRVTVLQPSDFRMPAGHGDAILLPDDTPPPGLRSLETLFTLAADRVVVISLPAFSKLTRNKLQVRRVEQLDDPIHAKVTYSNFATRGFALHDAFAFAWAGRRPGSFVQNHFRKTPAFKAFLHRHGFVTLLESVCNTDANSARAAGLFKRTFNGGLFVLDIEPTEAGPSTLGEPVPAVHLLLSILGKTTVGLGQYTVPVRTETALREMIRDMGTRFEGFVVQDEDVPVDQIETQLVTIGGEVQSYGLPLRPNPVVLIRSGLVSGDVESVYAVLTWLKHLVRPEPIRCPYTSALVGKFRIAWAPCPAGWEMREGWQRGGAPPAAPMDLELEDAGIAGLIDVVSVPNNQARVISARADGLFSRALAWLPTLFAKFAPPATLICSVPDAESFGERRTLDWRFLQHDLRLGVDANSFNEEIHRQVLEAGGSVLRIEVPGGDADFVAHSIFRTDVAAMLLEQVVGLFHGLIAVNRSAAAIPLDGFQPVLPGQAMILGTQDPAIHALAALAG